MSFHELTNDYPWLTKRMASALAFHRHEEIRHPKRNFFAGILSVFVPRFGVGGGASILVTVAMIGILAAIAIPAYQDYTVRAQVAAALTDTAVIKTAIEQYSVSNDAWPTSLIELGFENDSILSTDGNYQIGVHEGGIVAITLGVDSLGEERYLVFEPNVEEGDISWDCYGQNALDKHLPAACR